MTSTTEETGTAPATAADKPKPGKKARVAPQRARAAPMKAKSAPKAKTPKGAKKAAGIREGSKTETILGLMRRSGGATLKDIMKATSWQPHSVRGFISGTLGKKMGLTVESAKGEDGERTYSIKA
jgi:hypothetical protein